MRGHVGAVLTSGLAALALALAVLQAVVLYSHHRVRASEATASQAGQSNRYSVPGGRSGIPFLPFDKALPPPTEREGRVPQQKQQEEHRSPPPSRRSFPSQPGPTQPRKLTA